MNASPRSTLGRRAVAIAVTANLVGGCAAFGGGTQVSTTPLDPRVGSLGTLTRFETEPAAPAPKAQASNDRRGKKKRTTNESLYWAGIIVGSIGTALGVGSGIGAWVTQSQISDGYDNGATKAEIDDLERRGEVLGALSITGFSLGVLGFVTSIVTYGIDYTRCGPLAAKRRDCSKRQ